VGLSLPLILRHSLGGLLAYYLSDGSYTINYGQGSFLKGCALWRRKLKKRKENYKSKTVNYDSFE
jgi:hypothetical protein